MARYTIFTSGGAAGLEITDETDTFRMQVRTDDLCFDEEKTETGFSGSSPTDWENIDSSSLPGANEHKFRVGVRDGEWVIDQAKTVTGFSGSSPTDWENIEGHKL